MWLELCKPAGLRCVMRQHSGRGKKLEYIQSVKGNFAVTCSLLHFRENLWTQHEGWIVEETTIRSYCSSPGRDDGPGSRGAGTPEECFGHCSQEVKGKNFQL